MTAEAPTLIDFKTIARTIRFQQHPTMTACWIWMGSVDDAGNPVTTHGMSARQDVHQRLTAWRPGGQLWPTCGHRLCVNHHHMEQASRHDGVVLS